MKRVLCIRFADWPIQRLQRQLNTDRTAPLAIHTAATPSPETSEPRRSSEDDPDLKYVRTVFPAARSGPAVIAVSDAAWSAGICPGMPLAEARSIIRPLTQNSVSRRPVNRPPAPTGRNATGPNTTGPNTIDRNTTGRRASAAAGITPSEVSFHEWLPYEDRLQLLAAAELTRRFAPVVSLDEMPCPDSLLLDITGCAPLFGGESALAETLLKELQSAGYRCRIAIADTLPAAWGCCHPDGPSTVMPQRPLPSRYPANRNVARSDLNISLPLLIVPPGQQLEVLAPLPLAAGRLAADDIAILHQLGLRSLGQLFDLPRQDLPSRLSADAIIRVQQLTGTAVEMIRPIPEAAPIVAEWSSEFPADSLHELRQVMEHLLKLIGGQLEQRRIGTIRVDCQLFVADDSASRPQLLAFETVRSTQSAALLLELVTLRLETIEFPGAVRRVILRAVPAPLPVARQRDLFGNFQQQAAEDELALLVNRLNSRLGRRSVLRIRPAQDARPEYSVISEPVLPEGDEVHRPSLRNDTLEQLVNPAESSETAQHRNTTSVNAASGNAGGENVTGTHTTGGGSQRPLRLLPVPFLLPQQNSERLQREGFVWRGNSFRIVRIIGPERIQTGWWSECSVNRDYYRVVSAEGGMMWIFRDRSDRQWYLHGVFD